MGDSLPLTLPEYRRYGRQMILDDFGLPAQVKLRQSAVVVVGAGGLGCPALQHLAASGVGKLGIVDYDTVELSNLHRQLLHTEDSIGSSKARSAEASIRKINSQITVVPHDTLLTSANARSLLAPYDVILDCTDNAPARYLLSDTAVALGKPLVSGAAMKYDGQVCTYNLPPNGPCYRCIYPKPPAVETMGTCEETGVLGVVTGIIGSLQALECINIITGRHDKESSMLLFSASPAPTFRRVKLRTKRQTCAACRGLDKVEDVDYVAFCGGLNPDFEATGSKPGDPEHRIRAKDLLSVLGSAQSRIIDVRPSVEFGICHLPDSINVPLAEFISDPASQIGNDPEIITYIVCRLGNDSQIAAHALRDAGHDHIVKDLVGGLRGWSREVDPHFPVY